MTSSHTDLLQTTITHLQSRDPDLVERLQARDPSAAVSLVEARAVVVRLRALMMDATFDDTHIGPDVTATSELLEKWRAVMDSLAT